MMFPSFCYLQLLYFPCYAWDIEMQCSRISRLLQQKNPCTLHGPSNYTPHHSDFGSHSQSTVCLWFGCITDIPVLHYHYYSFFVIAFFKYVCRFEGVANVRTSSTVSKLSLTLLCVIFSSPKEYCRASYLLVQTIFLVPRSGFPSFSNVYNSRYT